MCAFFGVKIKQRFGTVVFHSIFFLGEKCKNRLSWRKMILRAFLIDLKCWWLSSGLTDFEKHQTPALLLMVDFLRIFKITHF